MKDMETPTEYSERDKGLIDVLFRQVEGYSSCDKFQAMLEFCARFREIAPYNAMLLQIQMPNARFVLSANQWKEFFNRQPKVNARPLITLVPFGPIQFLYEIGDTERCKESYVPKKVRQILTGGIFADEKYRRKDGSVISRAEMTDEEILDEFEEQLHGHESGIIDNKTFGIIEDNLEQDGIRCTPMVSGFGLDGKIDANNGGEVKILLSDIHIQVKGDVRFVLNVSQDLSKDRKFAAICHELGHLFCHHITNIPLKDEQNWWKVRQASTDDETLFVQEFEAEVVSWLVCQRLGVESNSVEFLKQYYQQHNTIPNISVDMVLKAAMDVEHRVKKHMNVKDCLLYKFDKSFKKKVDEAKENHKKAT